jgi:hypothetical protein
MRFFIALFLCTLLPLTAVFAQSDSSTFNIKVFGAEDIVAPTAPSSLNATPIAVSQIDLSWLASSDNFVVSGYVVFRNGVALATTTQLMYSDSGLTASTTYSYFVKAFDPSFNYSSSSNVAVATTPDNPPPPAGGGGTEGTATRVLLDQLIISPGVSTSTFSIKTKFPARFEIRWGRTSSYELGYTMSNSFTSTYKTTLTDLEPGTTYEYELIGYTPQGIPTTLERGKFTTLNKGESLIPANVNQFRAVTDDDDVALSWLPPVEGSYQYVRIVRSHLGFPTSPSDGEVVYQGNNKQYLDKDILRLYSPVYYTAFVVDKYGNVSSGAIAKAYAGATIVLPPTPGANPKPVATNTPQIPDGFTPGEKPLKETDMPDMSEIFIFQNDLRLSFADQTIAIDAYQPFTLSIPKSAITENLKSIIVTITDPSDSRLTSSFLLRINKDKTAYEAVVAPLDREGLSRIVIDIYDFEAKMLGSYQKTVTFTGLYKVSNIPLFPDRIILTMQTGWPYVLAGMFVAGGFFLIWRRRRKEEESV